MAQDLPTETGFPLRCPICGNTGQDAFRQSGELNAITGLEPRPEGGAEPLPSHGLPVRLVLCNRCHFVMAFQVAPDEARG